MHQLKNLDRIANALQPGSQERAAGPSRSRRVLAVRVVDPQVTALAPDQQASFAKALASGGKPWMPAQDHGFMYGTSFTDPDGNVWEPMWMDPNVPQ